MKNDLGDAGRVVVVGDKVLSILLPVAKSG